MAVVAAFVVSAVVAAAVAVAPLAWLHPRHGAACLLVLAEQRLLVLFSCVLEHRLAQRNVC